MPSGKPDEFRRVAQKLGFIRARQKGSHERWNHPDGRKTTIPIHQGQDIGRPLFDRMLKQMGITLETFLRLK